MELFQLLHLPQQELVLLLEDLSLLDEVLVVELDEIGVEADLLRPQNHVIFGLELLPEEVVLRHDLLPEFEQLVRVIPLLGELCFQQVDLVLVGQQQRLHVVQFLQVRLGVYDVDVLQIARLAAGQPHLVAQARQLLRELVVWVGTGVLMCSE